MLTILIIAVLSYVVFVASYVLWIHMDKRREIFFRTTIAQQRYYR